MDWIATIVVGVLSLLGVIFTNSASNQKMSAAIEKAQAITDTKLAELTREVREHNSFAQKIPVIEERLNTVCKRLDEIEGDLKR